LVSVLDAAESERRSKEDRQVPEGGEDDGQHGGEAAESERSSGKDRQVPEGGEDDACGVLALEMESSRQ
jgi:hypothetical protein